MPNIYLFICGVPCSCYTHVAVIREQAMIVNTVTAGDSSVKKGTSVEGLVINRCDDGGCAVNDSLRLYSPNSN